jgi:hypothetical protein
MLLDLLYPRISSPFFLPTTELQNIVHYVGQVRILSRLFLANIPTVFIQDDPI